ncbi:hypothetical protein [Rhodovastum atsumiense]|nr:hypothetical protein [Rhodovastum atsumiense]
MHELAEICEADERRARYLTVAAIVVLPVICIAIAATISKAIT